MDEWRESEPLVLAMACIGWEGDQWGDGSSMDGIETNENQRSNGDPFQMETSWIKENHTRWIEPTEWMGETSMGNLAANESKENLDNLGTRYGRNLGELTPALDGGKIQDEKDATNDTKLQADKMRGRNQSAFQNEKKIYIREPVHRSDTPSGKFENVTPELSKSSCRTPERQTCCRFSYLLQHEFVRSKR